MSTLDATWLIRWSCRDPGSSVPRVMDYLRKRDVQVLLVSVNAMVPPASIAFRIADASAHEAQQAGQIIDQLLTTMSGSCTVQLGSDPDQAIPQLR